MEISAAKLKTELRLSEESLNLKTKEILEAQGIENGLKAEIDKIKKASTKASKELRNNLDSQDIAIRQLRTKDKTLNAKNIEIASMHKRIEEMEDLLEEKAKELGGAEASKKILVAKLDAIQGQRQKEFSELKAT